MLKDIVDSLVQKGFNVTEYGTCPCITAPAKDHGMEGYVEGTDYEYLVYEGKDVQGQSGTVTIRRYVRVYESDDYYEVFTVPVFKQHFSTQN